MGFFSRSIRRRSVQRLRCVTSVLLSATVFRPCPRRAAWARRRCVCRRMSSRREVYQKPLGVIKGGSMPRASRPNRRVEMRQEVRPCVSFLAVSLAGRNRPVSTMAVYQPRQRPAIRRAPPYPTRPRVVASPDPPRLPYPTRPRVVALAREWGSGLLTASRCQVPRQSAAPV